MFMKKKYKIILPIMLLMVMVSACASQKKEEPTEPATIPAIETKADMEELIENKVSTIGIYKSEDIQEDVNGEYSLFTFTDEYGNDFVATISEDTVTPKKMEVDKSYEVIHSDIMTLSLPGIYPEVYEIREIGK